MISPGHDTATQRYLNALALFDEFVRTAASTAPDAAALRGLERRFAERIEIQPSYWSQIKGRSRQIGERLARQFEQRCGKPAGWLDHPQGAAAPAAAVAAHATSSAARPPDTGMPRDEDERFIVELVLTYYRRNPQRARQRLLDLLGEVLTPAPVAPPPPAPRPTAAAADAALWAQARQSIAPLKKKR
ncbi:hypothetical protein [Sphaerotilus sp.]|uniref:hypothetical protein n=1 Tax=Sphaerotilus sp. TaxID=2093942 RepID=UPI0034E1E890